ncbi:MAG: hypothetical protein R6U91_01185, partial [Bacillota bacterium]
YDVTYSEQHIIKEEDGWVLLICDLVPGTYEIEEVTSIDGWSVTYDPENQEVVVIDDHDEPGPEAYLTITNELELGNLKVLKNWAGPYGNDDLPDDITVEVFDEEDDLINTIILPDNDGKWEGGLGNLVPGSYYVIESEVPGFTTTYPDGNEATVNAGEAVYAEEIEILNTYPEPEPNPTPDPSPDPEPGPTPDPSPDPDPEPFTFNNPGDNDIVALEEPESEPEEPDTVEVDPEDPEVDPDEPEDPEADPDEPEEVTVDPEDPEVDPDDPQILTVDPEEPKTSPEAGGTSIPMISLGILLTSSGIIMKRYFN